MRWIDFLDGYLIYNLNRIFFWYIIVYINNYLCWNYVLLFELVVLCKRFFKFVFVKDIIVFFFVGKKNVVIIK